MTLTFGEFSFDPDRRTLSRNGEPVDIKPQSLDILALLLEHRPQPVSKDELVEKVWGGRAVSDDAIFAAFKKLRQTLGDNGQEQRIVKTHYGRGFAFIADVEEGSAAGETPRDRGTSRMAMPVLGLLALVGIIAAIWFLKPFSGDDEPSVTVAILPFEMAGENAAMGRDMAATMITELSDRPDFDVISATSSFSLGERGLTASAFAEEVGATHLVEGDVRRSGDRLELDLRLVDAADQRQIWSRTVSRNAVFPHYLADQAVQSLAAAIQVHLEVGDGRVDIPDGTPPDAIEDYRAGLEGMLTRDFPETGLTVHQLLESAADKAPNWADARGAFAASMMLYGPQYLGMNAEEFRETMRDNAALAFEIDPNNRWARLADAEYAFRYGGELERAIAELRALVKDEPQWPEAHRNLAHALLLGGHYREAYSQLEQTEALNPSPHRLGDFLRVQALRGLGQSESVALLANRCKAQCYHFLLGWYQTMLRTDYSDPAFLERDIANFEAALDREKFDEFALQRGLGSNARELMIGWLRRVRADGPRPSDYFGTPTAQVFLAAHENEQEDALAIFAILDEEWVPANGLLTFLFDDAMRLPEFVRTSDQYRSLTARPQYKDVIDYRRAQSFTAGLPDAN